jgi:hypothetical protein
MAVIVALAVSTGFVLPNLISINGGKTGKTAVPFVPTVILLS